VIVAGVCLTILFLAMGFGRSPKNPPLDPEEIRRVRRYAEQLRREEFPYE
jgi:hypothetical protein